jgi:AcrR family transcriptional regulator
MGRPKEHNQATRAALLTAAERLVAAGGPDALSVRAVAEEVGTTTRAVYSVFGSKEGLITALAQRAFELIAAGLDDLAETKDPVADLIETGVTVFRGFVLEHPSLYRIAFQRIVPGLSVGPDLEAARERTFPRLQAKVQRLADAGLLKGKSVRDAAVEFNALCEGLANSELRGQVLPILPQGREAQAWREALATLVRGFGSSPARRQRR